MRPETPGCTGQEDRVKSSESGLECYVPGGVRELFHR